MPANVDFMFSAREEVWFKGNHVVVDDALTSEEALKAAKLDFDVLSEPIFDSNGNVIEGYRRNVKSDDGKTLGIVGTRYKIINNTDAFSFVDALIGANCRYETAGSLNGYRQVWLMTKLEPKIIMGDKFNNYLVFSNSFDGTGAVKVFCTPTRVVCQNTLNLALRTTKRSWSTRHTGSMSEKLHTAEQTLNLANDYMVEVDKEYQKLALMKFSKKQVDDFLCQLFPIAVDDSARKQNGQQYYRDTVMSCYNEDDLGNCKDTAYGLLNAVSDAVCHMKPLRETNDYYSNNWAKVLDGHPVLDKAYDLVYAMA